MDIDKSLVSEFLSESKEHLEIIEEFFLKIEKQKENLDRSMVDKIFRAVHTLKSSAACLGFKKISSLAHSMEHILSLLRDEKITPEGHVIDGLLMGLDLICTMLNDLDHSDEIDISFAQKTLADLLVEKKPGEGETQASMPSPDFFQQQEQAQDEFYDFIAKATKEMDILNEVKSSLATFQSSLASFVQSNQELQENLLVETRQAFKKIQGPAAFFKLSKVSHISNTLDSLCQKILERTVKLTHDLSGKIEKAVEKIFTALENVNQGETIEIGDLLEQIAAAEKAAVPEPQAEVPSCSIPANEPPVSSPIEISKEATPEPEKELPLAAAPEEKSDGLTLEKDEAMIKDFIVEARDHLTTIEECFLELEKQPNNPDKNLINKSFGAIHSIKSIAGLLGFNKIRNIAHSLESILSFLRSGKIKPEPKFVDTFLKGVDLIETLIDDINNSEKIDTQKIQKLVDDLLAQISAPTTVPQPTEVPSTVPAEKETERILTSHVPPILEEATHPTQPNNSKDEKKTQQEASEKAEEKPSEKARSKQAETLRINVEILDKLMVLAGELVLLRNQLLFCVEKVDPATRAVIQRIDLVTSELQESIMRTRMQPIANVFSKFPRLVRDLNKKLGKRIELNISGNEVELDKAILEALTDPLTHIIRNSCDHGIETPEERIKAGKPEVGIVSIRAFHEGGQINIVVADDGKGIDPKVLKEKALEKKYKTAAELKKMSESEIMSMIFLPGFSTAGKVSEISGRGVGMDVVKANLDKLGGVVDFESQVGKGTAFHLRLPLTLAIIPCLIVLSGEHRYAIPQFNLVELVCLFDKDAFTQIEYAGNDEVFRLREKLLPLARLSEILARPEPFDEEFKEKISQKYWKRKEEALRVMINSSEEGQPAHQTSQTLVFAVLKVRNNRFGLIVDKVFGMEEIVVRPMHPAVKSCVCYSGATILGDGKVALILDIEAVAKHAGINLASKGEERKVASLEKTFGETQNFLTFKVGPNETFAIAIQLLKRIEKIKTAQIEKIGDKEFITINNVSTLVLRLDKLLKVSPSIESEEAFLFIPKFIKKPFGILVTKLIDVLETSVDLYSDNFFGEGLLGTGILNGQMTLFIDIYRLVEIAIPEWFEGSKKEHSIVPSNKKILVVEDTPFFRQLVKNYLESEGYSVTLAENGKTGLEKAEEGNFDIVVSDLEMPLMNGWEFMENLRQIPRYKKIPTIALSGLESDIARQKALDCGYNAFEKKMDREGFLGRVMDLLKESQQSNHPPKQVVPEIPSGGIQS